MRNILLQKQAAVIPYDQIVAILHELMKDTEGDLPLPTLKIVNNIQSSWNGLCTWGWGDPTSLIELQKSICHDERTVRRILAHELAHHEANIAHFGRMPLPTYRAIRKYEGGHGKTWQTIVARWNAKYGENFITEKSDKATVKVHDEKEFFVLIWKDRSARCHWASSVTLSVQAVRYLWKIETILGDKRPNEYRLFKTTDRDLLTYNLNIGQGGYTSRFDTPEIQDKATNLFETGTDLWEKEITTRIKAPTKPLAKFFVLISQQEWGSRGYMWQQAPTTLNDKQKEQLGLYARMVDAGRSKAKLVVSTNLFLKAGARLSGSRWSYPRSPDELTACEEAWNSPDLLPKYTGVYPKRFASVLLQPKSAAPISDTMKSQIYYHGTGSEAAAQAIIREGIQPRDIIMPDKAKSRSQLAPVPDRVYLTTNKGYAAIYAMGGQMFGAGLHDQTKTNYTADQWLKNNTKDGAYGYIFEIHGSQLTGDVVPDEDSIGDALEWLAKDIRDSRRIENITKYNEKEKWQGELEGLQRSMEIVKKQRINQSDVPQQVRMELYHLYLHKLTDRQKQNLSDIGTQAQVGKKLQKLLSQETCQWMIENGAHVAHRGAIFPTHCQRFSKEKALYTLKLGEILEDVPLPNKTAGGWPFAESPLRIALWNMDAIESQHEVKTASPDFGYAEFNDREKDLKKLRIQEPDHGVHLLEAEAVDPTKKALEKTQGYVTAEKMFRGKWGIVNTELVYAVTHSNINPEWRGTGLGQILYDRIISQAKKRGAEYLYSDVKPNNLSKDAESAWKRLGERYPVEFDASMNRYRIPLKSQAKAATTKTLHFQPLPYREFVKEQGFDDSGDAADERDFVGKEMEYEENVEHFGTLDFPCTIYRQVELPAGKSINFDEAGVYWSWVEDSAQAYFGGSSMWTPGGHGKGELVTIKAQVLHPNDVDWQGTLRANFIDPEENELRVLPGAELKLLGVQQGDDFSYKPVPGQMTITASQKIDMKKIEAIHKNLREEEGPGQCYTMSEILFHEFGLEQQAGFYLYSNPRKGHNGHGDHAWNITAGGVIVDGTHDQFGPPNVAILKPNTPEYKRYHAYCGDYNCPICTCPECNESFAEEAARAKSASHKQTPMSDTTFPNMDKNDGEGTNAYALQPERVEGNSLMPSLESLVPGAKLASMLPTFEQFLEFCADGKSNVISRLWGEVGTEDPYDKGPAEDVKKKQLIAKFNKAINKLRKITFPTTVYRKMRLKTPEHLRKHEVGLSWSTSERKARVIYDPMTSGYDYLYRGEIDADAVNWMETIYWRMSSVGDDEDELRLIKGASIRNLSMKSKGSWQPIDSQMPISASLEGDGQSSFFEEVENPHSVQPLRAPDNSGEASTMFPNKIGIAKGASEDDGAEMGAPKEAGAGDANAYIPRIDVEDPTLHSDPLFVEKVGAKKKTTAEELLFLKDYLTMTPEQNGEEVARTFPDIFVDWLEEEEIEIPKPAKRQAVIHELPTKLPKGENGWEVVKADGKMVMNNGSAVPAGTLALKNGYNQIVATGKDEAEILKNWRDVVAKSYKAGDAARAQYDENIFEALREHDEDAWESVPKNVFVQFMKDREGYLMQNDPADCPSFMHMSFEKMLPNGWLIHKTDDPDGICAKGFTIGMHDLSRLGLTTYYKESGKMGGYNFAFTAADARHAEGKYGRHAVIFQAAGVEVYHYGDSERQVIFKGSDAHNLIPVYESYGEWVLSEGENDEPVFQAGSLQEVVAWIQTNYSKYRKVIVKRASFNHDYLGHK